MHQAAANLQVIGSEFGYNPIALAVAWVAEHSGITAPIISARTVEQLRPSLAAMDVTMDETLYAALSALVPTPPPATDRLEEQS
jgi:aryl-alcohol dehydrogenase-like predicted oxidoreductase